MRGRTNGHNFSNSIDRIDGRHGRLVRFCHGLHSGIQADVSRRIAPENGDKIMKARVYWNLHKKCWSVQNRQTGKVELHAYHVVLADAGFTVRKAGQERVRKEGKKNVHAFAVGDAMAAEQDIRYAFQIPKQARPVTYNPYVNDTFVYRDTGAPVSGCACVLMVTDQKTGKPAVWAL